MEKEIKKIKQEINNLKLEVNSMADIIFRNKAERLISGFASSTLEVEHYQRYLWVRDFVKGLKVLDIACGDGYGSFLLSDTSEARKVVGGDVDINIIAYAKAKYKRDNLQFLCLDGDDFSIDDHFDVIVSFETIEHLKDPSSFLKNVKKSLKNNGLFIVSTPINFSGFILNEYHINEWNMIDFKNLIEQHFLVDSSYIQRYSKENKTRILIKRILNFLHLFKILKKVHNLFFTAGRDPLQNEKDYRKESEIKSVIPQGVLWPEIVNLDEIKIKTASQMAGYQILICKNVDKS